MQQFAELLTTEDLHQRRTALQGLVTELGAVLMQHDQELRRLNARIEQLELGLVYTDRGCGA